MLIPAIMPLDHPACCPAAAQALIRIDPSSHGGIPLTELADRLVNTAGNPGGYAQQRAVTVLSEIGPAGISAQARARLRHLAEQPQRIIRSGAIGHIIRNYETLRSAIRQLLDELG